MAQKSSLDDPVEDRTVTVVAPYTSKEEDLTIWLVQNKRVKSSTLIQMDDDLVNEFSIYAQDDDDVDHAALAQEVTGATFFETPKEEKKKPV